MLPQSTRPVGGGGQGLLRWFDRWFRLIPESRPWVRGLLVINLLGSLYGFNWYAVQLGETPLRFWPVVPDSPLSTLLFSFVLLVILAGRRWPLLEGIAYLSMLKYGLWTVAVFSQYWLVHRQADFESIHLSLSHLGMAVEAAIFLRVYSPPLVWGALGFLWLLFNDYMDYGQGFHPRLPDPGLGGSVALMAVSLSFLAMVVFLTVRNRAPDAESRSLVKG